MDHYSQERWMLERHRAMAKAAESRMRVRGWGAQASVAELVAARLRLLADRLDRPEPTFTVVSGSR
ncbi:MAG TPA: hypothetical protein VFB69_00315 [Candidatus Dormibacteraeota bacterium]|nr:hypothetical protein [Candidatus Dormibacteraeota bacterium]